MIGPLTSAELAAFLHDGYLMKRRWFSSQEMDLLIRHAKGDESMISNAGGFKDAAGRISRINLWNHPGDDLYGMFSRCRRIVDASEQLLDDEVYHYHSKMMLKEPRVGGAWEWHQDYGYWYGNGCMYPDMLSVMVAVDRAERDNGCLQVLKGSHSLGRVEHGRFGDQVGADPTRVEQARKRLELVHVEAEASDTLFFHCNLLHGSAANTSERSRWSLIMAYNSRHNDPYQDAHHPCYTPLMKVPDAAIMAWASDPRRESRIRSGNHPLVRSAIPTA